MRATAEHALDFGARLPDEDLETAIRRLRAHLALLIPEAEERLGRFSPAGIEEARRRVAADPGVLGPGRHAHCLARSVLELCEHLGRAGGAEPGVRGAPVPEPWVPPAGPAVELVAAGRYWDAVRVRADVGERVIKRLADTSGAVIQDSYGSVFYWLVTPGAADAWDLPPEQVVPLGVATFVAVPPPQFTDESRRLRWIRPLTVSRCLTDPTLLHDALAAETLTL